MGKFIEEKTHFLNTVVPQWDEKANERQGKMDY
jgi:hypothetical protein